MDVKEEQFQSVCRTCLSEKDNMRDIFNIADVLMTCTPIQIEQGDGLPTTICFDCVTQVNQAYEFRILCEQSDNVLRKKLIKEHLILIKTDSCENELSETCSTQHSASPELIIDENREDNNYLGNSKTVGFEETNDIITSKPRRCKKSRKKDVNKENAVEQENKTEKFEEQIKEIIESQINDIAKSQKKENAESDTTENTSEEEETGEELSCKYCDLKFRYKVRLKRHEQKHLTGLKCHLCGKDFSTVKQLTNHINIHSRKGSHLCQTCGKQFTLPENLVRHLRIHSGVKPYKCHHCNKSFIQSNELKSHLITHSSEKPHLCSICGNKYARLISLRVHMRRIHSIPPNFRPHICAVCGRNFKDRRDLSQHMLIHTGERSHICGVCGKAFNRSSNLRVHERIHNGQKPHVCSVCQRAFIQKHVLMTHMRTHPHAGKTGG